MSRFAKYSIKKDSLSQGYITEYMQITEQEEQRSAVRVHACVARAPIASRESIFLPHC